MNRIKIFITAALALIMASCTEKPVETIEYLEVNAHNISGKWELVQWNGNALEDGTYFYIEFIRKDRKYVIYQNFKSIGELPQVLTGTFNIETDVELGAIIRGMYDFDGGYWAHDYEVNNLTSGQMEWVAVDDIEFTQKFVKSKIPAELKK